MKHIPSPRALALAAAALATAGLAACGSGDGTPAAGGDGTDGVAAETTSVSVDPAAPPLGETGTTYNFAKLQDDGMMVSLGNATTAYDGDEGWVGVRDTDGTYTQLPEGVYEIAVLGSCPGSGAAVDADSATVIGEMHVKADHSFSVHNRPAEMGTGSVSGVALLDGDQVAGCGRAVNWTRPTADGE